MKDAFTAQEQQDANTAQMEWEIEEAGMTNDDWDTMAGMSDFENGSF